MYAKNTNISVEKTEAAIKKLIMKYGATSILCGWSDVQNMAMVAFQYKELPIKIFLPLPDKNSDVYCLTKLGKERRLDAITKSWEQACRARWRALLLIIKAKLEAIEIGATTPEKEFMANLILPNGHTTMFDLVEGKIQNILKEGKFPKLLTM